MKFIHLSDLHLGKFVEEFPMIDDQIHIMDQIFAIIQKENPQGVLIAGDVYDRSIPPIQATALLDDFLGKLAKAKIPTFLISGNHDSPERLAFGEKIFKYADIHISPAYQGTVSPITLKHQGEEVDIYLLPFLKPVHVKKYFPDADIQSYTQAVQVAIEQMQVPADRTAILVTHQFVTGGVTSESEEFAVGGSDNVDATVFDPFHYVALGHLHGPQNIGTERIRYCGSPLKYSFSELNHKKSLTVVEISPQKALTVTTRPLVPLREMGEIKGKYEELVSLNFYQNMDREIYLRVILADEEPVMDALGRLRTIYPNIMKLTYENRRTKHQSNLADLEAAPETNPLQLFSNLYQEQNGQELSEKQKEYLENLIKTIWEETP